LDCLHSGDLETEAAWEGWHSTDRLLASFLDHCGWTYDDHCGWTYDKASATQFGMRLTKRIPGAIRSRQSHGRGQTYGYRLPSLHECRRAFDEWFSEALDWPPEPPDLKAVEAETRPGRVADLGANLPTSKPKVSK
jgi:hypothetical protein